jgi:hypothetical protein
MLKPGQDEFNPMNEKVVLRLAQDPMYVINV